MLEKKKKKLVIDEDIVKDVSNALQAFIEHIDSDCAASGCMCDLREEVCSQYISNTLHDFESGLCLLKASSTKGGPKEKMIPHLIQSGKKTHRGIPGKGLGMPSRCSGSSCRKASAGVHSSSR